MTSSSHREDSVEVDRGTKWNKYYTRGWTRLEPEREIEAESTTMTASCRLDYVLH